MQTGGHCSNVDAIGDIFSRAEAEMKLQEEEEEKALEEYCRDDAHLAKLGFNDDQETKKTNKRKSAPRSLAPDGPRRRNPVRLSRAKTNYEL